MAKPNRSSRTKVRTPTTDAERTDRRLFDSPDMASPQQYGWNASRKKIAPDHKRAMATYFVEHEYLLDSTEDPEGVRRTDASILVNPGTTPFTLVKEAVEWMSNSWDERGPFNITWYSPGLMVATLLYNFRDKYHGRRSAADLFVFPGKVDQDLGCVLGEYPVKFAEDLQRRMTYSFLSVHRLSLADGKTYFHFENEVELQRA